jgi:hypothetical protein
MNKMNDELPSKVELDEGRRRTRRIMDQLTTGERFMLMFGRGKVVGDPPRVELSDTAAGAVAAGEQMEE